MTTTDHDWSELDGIVKHRYHTGDYGSAHIAITTALFADMRDRCLPPSQPGSPLFQLIGIPIVLDDTLEEHEWHLRDNATREVLRSGSTRPAEEASRP